MREEKDSMIRECANAMADPDKAKAKAARLKMQEVTHQAARPGARKDEAGSVLTGLMAVVRDGKTYNRMARAHAARLIGFLGGRGEERALGGLEKDPEIGEDVRMARERIRRA